MTRTPKLTRPFLRNAKRLGALGGTERGRAVARTIWALAAEITLPALSDTEAVVPPTRTAYVRLVPGRNLWLWYSLGAADELAIVALTADPPVSRLA